MANSFEPGYNGSLVSLGGVVGKPFTGRQIKNNAFVLAAFSTRCVLESNAKRISALIKNVTGGVLWLAFNSSYTAGDGGLWLDVGESFQIDQNFPWTGAVTVVTDAGCTVETVEVTIP